MRTAALNGHLPPARTVGERAEGVNVRGADSWREALKVFHIQQGMGNVDGNAGAGGRQARSSGGHVASGPAVDGRKKQQPGSRGGRAAQLQCLCTCVEKVRLPFLAREASAGARSQISARFRYRATATAPVTAASGTA